MKHLLAFALVFAAAFACVTEEHVPPTPPPPPTVGRGAAGPISCRGNECSCNNASTCHFDVANAPGWRLRCQSDSECLEQAGDQSAFACGDTARCLFSLGARAAVTCERGSDCAGSLGAGGRVSCNSMGTCRVNAGPGVVTLCDHVGTCSASCQGDCALRAVATGNAAVRCANGAPPRTCPDGLTQICGQMDCPR